jgi:hypothetical protein
MNFSKWFDFFEQDYILSVHDAGRTTDTIRVYVVGDHGKVTLDITSIVENFDFFLDALDRVHDEGMEELNAVQSNR